MANPIYTPANSANDPLNQYKNPTPTPSTGALPLSSLGVSATYPGYTAKSSSVINTIPSSMAQTKPSTYTGSSIVDYLGSTGQANDYASRAKLAQQSGIQNYAGTAEQNTQLLNTLRGSSAPATQTTNTSAPYNQTPATGTTYTGTSPVVTPPPVTPPVPPPPTGQTGLSYDAAQQGLYGQLIADLASRYNQPTQAYTDAMKQYQDINAQLQASKTNEAGQLAANAQNPIPLEFQQGRGQVLQNQFLQQQAALAGQLQGASNVLGQANTQQGLQQQALSTAAGLAAPVGAQALGFYNPVTGQYSQYGGGQGQGGAFTAGQVQGNVGLGAQYTQMNAANTAAKGYENTINTYLRDNPGLNPSDLTVVNGMMQWGGSQLGNPKYQTLANYLNEYANTLAPILGAGGSITDYKTGLAQSLVNGKASGQSIAEVLANISKAADDKLANMQSAGTGGGVVAGGSAGYKAPTGGNTFGSFFGQ